MKKTGFQKLAVNSPKPMMETPMMPDSSKVHSGLMASIKTGMPDARKFTRK